jgi:hypothetical protein
MSSPLDLGTPPEAAIAVCRRRPRFNTRGALPDSPTGVWIVCRGESGAWTRGVRGIARRPLPPAVKPPRSVGKFIIKPIVSTNLLPGSVVVLASICT